MSKTAEHADRDLARRVISENLAAMRSVAELVPVKLIPDDMLDYIRHCEERLRQIDLADEAEAWRETGAARGASE